MWTRHRKRRQYGRLIVPVISAAFLSYFGYHSIHGSFGLIAQKKLEADRAGLLKQLTALKVERQSLERRALLLKDGSIEKDILDEQARRALNVVRPDEIVILR